MLWRGCLVSISLFFTSAGAVEVNSQLDTELQLFSQHGPSGTHRAIGSLGLQAEITHAVDEQDLYFTFIPFYRWDQHDDERSHADIRELKLVKVFDQWELEAGISKVFWGVAEANHLVDIINQTDHLEGLDGEEKLGQPLIRLSRIFDQSTVSLFVLPGFRERAYLGAQSRFALPFPIDTDNPQFESVVEDQHIDYALRYSGYAGQMDYGVSWFSGTAREAQLVPQSVTPNTLQPYYAQIDRLGLDLQYTQDAWLWKLEAIREEGSKNHHSAYVAGLEYTLYGMSDGSYDLGLITEYNQDSRDDARSVFLQNDLFVGTRFGFNDVESTTILAGGIIDLDDDSTSLRLEASRRVFDQAKLSLEAQAFSHVAETNLSYPFRDNDFLKLTLSWFF